MRHPVNGILILITELARDMNHMMIKLLVIFKEEEGRLLMMTMIVISVIQESGIWKCLKIHEKFGHRSLSIFDDGGGVPDSPIRDIVMLCWL